MNQQVWDEVCGQELVNQLRQDHVGHVSLLHKLHKPPVLLLRAPEPPLNQLDCPSFDLILVLLVCLLKGHNLACTVLACSFAFRTKRAGSFFSGRGSPPSTSLSATPPTSVAIQPFLLIFVVPLSVRSSTPLSIACSSVTRTAVVRVHMRGRVGHWRVPRRHSVSKVRWVSATREGWVRVQRDHGVVHRTPRAVGVPASVDRTR
mmetsp:Transcript_7612/g.14399  ORF Transcript_7612/g.14399 Transcript_7612/m.14399 type:complete len:204 (-) Transcript_7612:2648-3259(-)